MFLLKGYGKSKVKGVKLRTEETDQKRYVRSGLQTLVKEPEAVEDLLDGLIADPRRLERTTSHKRVMRI